MHASARDALHVLSGGDDLRADGACIMRAIDRPEDHEPMPGGRVRDDRVIVGCGDLVLVTRAAGVDHRWQRAQQSCECHEP